MVTKTEIPAKPLWVCLRFPLLAATFFVYRLIRPVLVAAFFSNGLQATVAGAQACLVLQWLGSVFGLLGVLLLQCHISGWLHPPGASPRAKAKAEAYLKPSVLMLLGFAVFLEFLYEVLAVGFYQFFWGLGMVDASKPEMSSLAALAGVLVILQVGNLVGAILLVVAYARSYLVSWDDAGVALWAFPAEGASGSGEAADVESGEVPSSSAPSARPPRARGPQSQVPGPIPGWEKDKGPRQAGVNSRDASPRQSPRLQEGIPSYRRKFSTEFQTPPRGKSSSPTCSPRPKQAPADRPPASAERPAERPPLGAMPKAWLWVASEKGGEWVRVRIIRSSTNGTATVRLPDGGILQANQSFLRPRGSNSEEPPNSEPRRERPSSANAGARNKMPSGPRGPSKERPSSASFSEETRGGSVPPGWRDFSSEDCPGVVRPPAKKEPPKVQESPGELWAKARLAKLRKELQELNNMEPAERRVRIRGLQRELHPDKLPEDLRPHAQPLFHIVQREWEVDEAARNSAQPVAQAGG